MKAFGGIEITRSAADYLNSMHGKQVQTITVMPYAGAGKQERHQR
jgi:hypothetical protein